MSPEEEVSRAAKAQRVLADDMYNEAYSVIRDRIVQQLSQAETAGEKRERLNALLVSLETVRRYMEQVVISGKMAAQQIERDRTFTERVGAKIRGIA